MRVSVWMGVACQDPRFPSRTFHCNEMINATFITSVILLLWLTVIYQDVAGGGWSEGIMNYMHQNIFFIDFPY